MIQKVLYFTEKKKKFNIFTLIKTLFESRNNVISLKVKYIYIFLGP